MFFFFLFLGYFSPKAFIIAITTFNWGEKQIHTFLSVLRTLLQASSEQIFMLNV